jgi:hypothetical protein
MTATLSQRSSKTLSRTKKVATVLRVAAGEQYIGDILLDSRNRVWRRAEPLPTDVVLKILLAYSRRGESFGQVTGRQTGQVFTWIRLND